MPCVDESVHTAHRTCKRVGPTGCCAEDHRLAGRNRYRAARGKHSQSDKTQLLTRGLKATQRSSAGTSRLVVEGRRACAASGLWKHRLACPQTARSCHSSSILMKPNCLLAAALCSLISRDAYAVDGAGFASMFPLLNFFLWVGISCLPVFAVYRMLDVERREASLVWLLGVWLTLIALPYAYAGVGKMYAAHLCATEASTQVFISPERWLGIAKTPEREQLSRPTLIEHRETEQLKLGAWSQTFRLEDPATRVELMRSRAYFSTRISHPYGCGGNDAYWQTRERFAKMASIQPAPRK